MECKPFLKWAGGKSQLLESLEKLLPEHIKLYKTVKKYVEPFVGGGALFFFLKRKYQLHNAVLLDKNKDLINCYLVVKNHPDELIKQLKCIERKYLTNENMFHRRWYYNDIRTRYNSQKDERNARINTRIMRAAYLIFLNRTCFNGLYRLNSKGGFNVPHGKHENPTICDKKNILAVSKALQNVTIKHGNFTECEKYITPETLVYFDPPYRPLSKTANFTSYTNQVFTEEDQKRLAKIYHKLAQKKNVYLLLSNSDPKNENPNDDFFEKLYSRLHTNTVTVKACRMINCDATGRKEINELIIRNYKR